MEVLFVFFETFIRVILIPLLCICVYYSREGNGFDYGDRYGFIILAILIVVAIIFPYDQIFYYYYK